MSVAARDGVEGLLTARPPGSLSGVDGVVERALRRRAARRVRGETYMRRAEAIIDRGFGLRDACDGPLARLRRGSADAADVDAVAGWMAGVAAREIGLAARANQIATALALADGVLVELATGEGKTLAAAIAAGLNAMRGDRVHVVTANDYLAARDAEFARPMMAAVGLGCESVVGGTELAARRRGYESAVVYSTARELAADYLRTRTALRSADSTAAAWSRLRSPGKDAEVPATGYRLPGSVIVDEADFVLIDDAATPLVLSEAVGEAAADGAVYVAAREVARSLGPRDVVCDEAASTAELTGVGRARVDAHPAWGSAGATLPAEREHLVTNAVMADRFFEEGDHYVVSDSGDGAPAIALVDRSTGRIAADRTLRGGLHQALEAKHGLRVTARSTTTASVAFQRFFRLVPRLSGLTGTAADAAGEFASVYDLPTVRVPTHRPCVREELRARAFGSASARDEAAAEVVERASRTGRPVLVASDSVAGSERFAALLRARHVSHAVLNAVNHEEEAAVVARAGEAGAVTVSTNMAGRGTDIKLTAASREAGGLLVVSLTPGPSARYDKQMFGRSGRQGDPGAVVRFVSMEDALLVRTTGRQAALLSRMGGEGEFGGALRRSAWSLASAAQRRTQARAARQRRRLAEAEAESDIALGFAPEA